MWVTFKDYEDFVKNGSIVYFQVDLAKILDELFFESQILSGITLEDLNNKCMKLYYRFLDDCPEDVSFEEYILQKVPIEAPITREILCKIHQCFSE